MNTPADVTVRSPSAVPGAGYPPSLVLLVPQTCAARDWLEDHAADTWAGDALACERRYATQLLAALFM